jgi:hypothetical protein
MDRGNATQTGTVLHRREQFSTDGEGAAQAGVEQYRREQNGTSEEERHRR